jgi:hypothetical protein
VAAVLLAAVLALGAWTFAHHGVLAIRSPWSRDYGEGCVLAMAQLLARGGSYFPDLQGYPYLVANYPPVFIGLVALGERTLGPTLAFPRTLAFVSGLAVVGALFAVLRRLAPPPLAAAMALLFLLPWFSTTWAGLARVDTLAIALSLAALGVALRHGAERAAWPALVLAWLAFFTKQNALLAPAAVLGDLLLARDRRFPRALAAYALPLAALFALLVAATGGEAWRHLVPYTAAAGYEPDRMAESYLQFALVAAPLLATIAAAAAIAPSALLAAGEGRTLALYFALNLAALSTIAKAGAAQNYFLEPWAATILLAGHALRVLGARRAVLRDGAVAVVLAAACAARFAYPSLDRLPQALRRPGNADEFPVLTRLVRETKGPVLSENLSLLVVSRRPVLLEPFGVLLLAQKGLLRTDRLTADCEAGRFPLVITEHRMSEIPGFGECLERRYEPFADLGPYRALRPLPSSR